MSDMDVSLVRAGKKDAPLLLEMVEAFHALFAIQHTPESRKRAISPCLEEDGPAAIWLIQYQEKCAGYLILAFGYSVEFGGRDAFVDEVFLLPEYRGKGLGRQAILLLEKEAKAFQVVAMHLEVRRDDPQAQALYRRCGFVPRERYFLLTSSPA
ncbi:MAG: GNAT family N-acetyltransferase [Myxococcales bacterium]|nr:GNAT family N-acetyltransferase [Myxococcales bacterium]MCB9644770.1 GNAT family N-acetyltransferase [Myxococcales bacterium]